MTGEELRTYREPETTIDEFFLEEQTNEAEKQRVRKQLGMTVKKQKLQKHTIYDRMRLRLAKAGLFMKPADAIKKILFTTIILTLLAVTGAGLVLVLEGFSYIAIILYLLITSIMGFFIFYPLILLAFNIVLSYKAFKRKLEVERVLPEFLRLVATNYRSGMPLDKAITKSNRPRFGIFSKEIALVAKTAKVKGDLGKALEIFGKKFDSKILQRAMNNIVMSIRSGSNVSELLEEIASNITKMRNMRTSMAANVKNYVIFIVVAGVIIAPLMFSMSYVMNTTIAGVKGTLVTQESSSVSPLISVQEAGGVQADDFNVFAILMLITNSFFSAFIISMIKYGNIQQGIRRIPLFIILSVALYAIGKYALQMVIVVI